MMPVDLTGKTFNKWTVICRDNSCRASAWLCKCTCGAVHSVRSGNLKNGGSKGCKKCSIPEIGHRRTHGMTATKTYHTWCNMRRRCYDERNSDFHSYGGRGITVCERWKGVGGFKNFLEDMGAKPSKIHTLDRIDVNLGYSKDNCRWATHKEQSANTRRNVYFYIDGIKMCMSDAARKFNKCPMLLRYHVKKHGVEQATEWLTK